MFSETFSESAIRELLARASLRGMHALELMDKSSLDLEDMAVLLCAPSDLRPAIVAKAISGRRRLWNNKLFIMPPLYVSDGDRIAGRCLGGCVYCPFDKSNRHVTSMTPEETEKEVRILLDQGHKDVELVAAVDRELLFASGCIPFINAARNAGAKHVGINLFPLRTAEEYSELAAAGVDFVVVWQETYDAAVYQKTHPHGFKSNMKYRLDAHDRALQGGIKTVGVAFLGGLSDWRYDAISTMVHARYLVDRYGVNIIFGTPRMKHVEGLEFDLVSYSDKEFIFVGALYSLFMPEALLWWATRERYDLSIQAAKGGGALFTLTSSTKVSGYSSNKGTSQFPVHSTDLGSGLSMLRENGFHPELCLPW